MSYIKITAPVIALMFFAALVSGQDPVAPLPGEITQPGGMFRGNPYLIDEWLDGEIILSNGSIVGNIKLKYDGYRDDVLWLHERNMQHIILDRSQLSGFTLTIPETGEKLQFKKIERAALGLPGMGDLFVEVLFSDTVSLYVHRRIVKIRDIYERRGRSRYIFAEIESDPVYYFLLPGNTAIRLDNINRRSLYRAFPEKRNELRQLLRRSRRTGNDEQALVETAIYLNKLLGK